MLYRLLGENRICITQPTHAWVSGQLAHVWGNETFGAIAPYEAVCLAAEQHDIGWILWESAPTLNPDTGYPHSFNEVAPEVHTQLWAGAKQLAMPMGRYDLPNLFGKLLFHSWGKTIGNANGTVRGTTGFPAWNRVVRAVYRRWTRYLSPFVWA